MPFLVSERASRRGSVLVVVLVTLLFASLALFAFIEKASDDLLVELREADARRLRREAYSALETVLAVLQEFRLANGGLRNPEEGWGDPLGFAGYEPEPGRQVQVAFVDESGRASFPRSSQAVLVSYFETLGFLEPEAERVAEALLHWSRKDFIGGSSFTPTYSFDEWPFDTPQRSLRSWSELKAIDAAREVFFTKDGQPNELWTRFTGDFSLLDYAQSNINAASEAVLETLGLDPAQKARLKDYLAGTGSYEGQGKGLFLGSNDLSRILGVVPTGGQVGTEIRALRIAVSVWEGRSSYRLTVLVSPGNQASFITSKAQNKDLDQSTEAGKARSLTEASALAGQTRDAQRGQTGSSAAPRLAYPFTILEIRENDVIAIRPETKPLEP